MLTHKKKALSFILCLTMLLSVVVLFIPGEVALPAEARTIFDIENELNQYKSLLAGIKNEMASIRADIASLRGKSDENIALLEQYRAEIDLLESEIAVNEAVKESYDLKRAQIIAQLTTVQEDYDYRLSLYRNLMQYIYENGDVNTFEMLFSSESFADFLSRRENYNAIMTCANGYMKEIQTTISDLRVLSDELAETQKEYDEYISALKLAEIEKEEKIQNFNTIAASLGLNIDSLNEQYSQKNARVQEINAKIKTLEEERLKYYNSNAEFIWPLPIKGVVTSYFGYRLNPFGKPTSEYHSGLDIAAAEGTPIYAVRDGVITARTSSNTGYGNHIMIYHGNGITTIYAHMSKFAGFKVGDNVKAGQVIGYVGSTGRSTGNHLHLGVKNGSTLVDPGKYLPDGYYVKR